MCKIVTGWSLLARGVHCHKHWLIKEAQVWMSSDLGLEQSGKSIPLISVVEKASYVALMLVLVSKIYFLTE